MTETKPTLNESPKDHAEHLRLVHFALMATCFALLVLTFSGTPDEVARAQEQINRVLTLARDWPSSDLKDQANEQVVKTLERIRSTSIPGLDVEGLRRASPESFSDQTVEIVSPKLPEIPRLLSQPLQLAFEAPNWIVDNQSVWASRRSLVFDGGLFKRESGPRSIRDFAQLWNALGEQLTIYIPVKLSQFLYTVYSPNRDFRNVETREWRWSLTGAGVKVVPVPLPGALPGAVISTAVWLSLQKLDDKELAQIHPPDVSGPVEFGYVARMGSPLGGGKALFDAPTRIVIPVADGVRPPFAALDGQQLLAQSAGWPSWRHGNFQESFPELAAITNVYANVDLETAEKILAGEVERRKERLEVWGVRVPSEDATRWGSVIVVAIQLYFWLHLMAFVKRLGNTQTGVAWIGLYDGWWAGLVFLASAYALPVFVVGFIAARAHAARKVDQLAGRKVDHLRAVHSSLF